MRRVWACQWSLDNKFIVSGSDDYSVRIWKANASAPLKHLYLREKKKLEYNAKLRERFGEFEEIKKINNQRMIPKYIKTAQKKKRVMANSRIRKLRNQQSNTKKTLEPPTIKKNIIVQNVE